MTRLHGMDDTIFHRRDTLAIIAASFALGCLATVSVNADTVEGFTEPYRHIDIAAASEAGLITEITTREGQSVKCGELLATLDIDVLDAALNVARERSRSHGRIDAAKAEVQVRRTRLEKLKELHIDGHATRGEIERAHADLAIAESNLVLAEEERRLNELECKRIEAQIDRRKIRSPIDGVVVGQDHHRADLDVLSPMGRELLGPELELFEAWLRIRGRVVGRWLGSIGRLYAPGCSTVYGG